MRQTIAPAGGGVCGRKGERQTGGAGGKTRGNGEGRGVRRGSVSCVEVSGMKRMGAECACSSSEGHTKIDTSAERARYPGGKSSGFVVMLVERIFDGLAVASIVGCVRGQSVSNGAAMERMVALIHAVWKPLAISTNEEMLLRMRRTKCCPEAAFLTRGGACCSMASRQRLDFSSSRDEAPGGTSRSGQSSGATRASLGAQEWRSPAG
jgi:hypothetical protein